VRVLKIRVFLVIENHLLRDVLARRLRRQADVELSGKGGSGETDPGEVAKSGSDVALLDFLDPKWVCLANCYGRADFAGNRAAQVNWLSLSERIRWQ
jgi:hypothetical protein